MASSVTSNASAAPPAGHFALTRWSVVLAAGGRQSTQARDALEQLCRSYWQPIYLFIRRQGHSPADAQDLTQEFFSRLLRKNALEQVDSSKGRFRSFLLATLKHFLANEWDKARAQKRGGDQVLLSIDGPAAEHVFALEAANNLSPDKIFERRWALTLLDRILGQVRSEYEREGKTELFDQLKFTLTGVKGSLRYAEIARRLGMSEGAVKVAVHRLRQHYRDLLRAEIAHTVSGPQEIEAEIGALFRALET